ncbi:tail fiber domain-containing protein [Vibrio sp. S9_S30]|uniref:tail fiber domain-containing protein n=1 Tax=Vibrio sp. S9_S30 TaxID=2720226 RepID=UPI0016804EA0|nr:tail fiber domain-containing protein [Vibrio sp. S9_S30]MBD1557845.1 tail fiber domain-containing protein [Vibrio sp. S9_S30]
MTTDIKLGTRRIDNIANHFRFGQKAEENTGPGIEILNDNLIITSEFSRRTNRTIITPTQVRTKSTVSDKVFSEEQECRKEIRVGSLAEVTERTDNETGSIKVITPKDTPDIHVDGNTGAIMARNFRRTSDERLKKNIHPILSPHQLLNQLNGVTFLWKDSHSNTPEYGLIAQQVEAVLPSLVDEDAEGMKSVDYEGLIPLLLETTKQLHQQVQRLEERIMVLEAK